LREQWEGEGGGAFWAAQRAVYTVRFAGLAYVLHAFQKEAKSGIATPRHEIALIEQRLKRAREDYDQWLASTKTKSQSESVNRVRVNGPK
jgi:hypothetical protein